MKLLDIKNNLVKVTYTQDEQVTLASFIVLVDGEKSYIAQVVNLKAEPTANYAIARLILVFNSEGILDNFDGSIPSIKAETVPLDAKQLLSLLPIQKPVILGDLAQQHSLLSLDITLLEQRLLICAEKFDNINIIVNNFVKQLSKDNERSVIIDTDYTFEEYEPIKLKKDFKLPLNTKMLDYIYENDLEDTDAATKAVIEEILSDVREYSKNVKFIPFENFIKVVSDIYNQTQIPELALLKNKLLKYNEQNIFAQNANDINNLKKLINENSITFIDIADIPAELQKEVISYIQDTLEEIDDYIYSFVKINNKNSDKKLLLKLTNSEKVFTTIICSHGYKYVSELKQLAENIILFAPQTAQHDFAAYNTYLSKLNANEFIVYGNLTQNIPFVVELANIEEYLEENEPPVEVKTDSTQDEYIHITAHAAEEISEPVITEEDLSDDNIEEQVAKEVDDVFINNKIEEIQPIDNLMNDGDEVLTEDDLDFIEELPPGTEEIVAEPIAEAEEVPTDFTEEQNKNNGEFEISEPETPIFEEQQAVFETSQAEDNNEVPSEIEEFAISEEEPEFDNIGFNPEDNEVLNKEIAQEGNEDASDLPVFPAEETISDSIIELGQGDEVSHPKYGKGVVEKLIKYGNKTLCSISFEDVGRRLLDPNISELQKLS